MLFIAVMTFLVLAVGKVWPGLEYLVRDASLAAVAASLYVDLSEPVDDDVIRILPGAPTHRVSASSFRVRQA